jgi:pimeloyl-ACP methyl ester carboxylesterase
LFYRGLSLVMLVLIHGMFATPEIRESFIPYFEEKKYHCKALDLREGLDLRTTRFYDYVARVKEHVTSRDVVIGHSMGGIVLC